ncbi:hypothetical protein N9812_03120 [bacterium]|nr:hypothetical protein [bacterium]
MQTNVVTLVDLGGNTVCGEAKTMNNALPQGSDLVHPTGEQSPRPRVRRDTKTVNKNPRVKWPSVHFGIRQMFR